tara:strand:+ start:24 stop:134 length:111 start_codon:yes stop_codon:yes gene_type:complete
MACNLSQTLRVLMEVHAEINDDQEMLQKASLDGPVF